MDDTPGYPAVRAVFVVLLGLVLIGDVALLLRMSTDILSWGS